MPATAVKMQAPSRGTLITVEISGMKISCNSDETLVTYSLGSCIGLSLYDPVSRIGGMIHCMLPLSKIDRSMAMARPSMFVDTGVTCLLDEMFKAGAGRMSLIAKVAGGGSPLGREETFQIGKRNHTTLRKLLRKNNIHIDAELVGGSTAKTMYLFMGTGETLVKVGGREVSL